MTEPHFSDVGAFLAAHARGVFPLAQKSETARELFALCNGQGDESLAVLHGLWAHEMALAAGLQIHSFFICPTIAKWPETAGMAAAFIRLAERSYTITERTFARISDYGDPDGILSLARLPLRDPAELSLSGDSVVFVLDGLTKPGNIGVILRSCDGAGVTAVLTCNLRTRVTHPNAIKASMGAAFSLPIAPCADSASCRDWLLRNNFTIYIADPGARVRYDGLSYPGRTAVVLGNEHKGASRVWYDGGAVPLSIPMSGACDSLNVSVAGAVLAYTIQSRRQGTQGTASGGPLL